MESAETYAEHIGRQIVLLEEILQHRSRKRHDRKVHRHREGIFMTLGKSINIIKDKAENINLDTLFENPEVYFEDLVELLSAIREIEEPTRINLKDLKGKVHQA